MDAGFSYLLLACRASHRSILCKKSAGFYHLQHIYQGAANAMLIYERVEGLRSLGGKNEGTKTYRLQTPI